MILLDTNALLWLYEASERLGPAAAERLRAADRVYYSAVSVMEIVIKHMLGRLELPGDADFPAVFGESGLTELAFTSAHGAAMRLDSALARHDPFDRMLLAQARVERFELMTSDRTLLGQSLPWIVDATK